MQKIKQFLNAHPRLARLAPVLMTALFVAFGLPIALTLSAVAPVLDAVPGGRAAVDWADWMIQPVLAQTYTVGTLSTEVAGTLTDFIPSYQVYITLGVIFLLAAYAFGRFMRSGR